MQLKLLEKPTTDKEPVTLEDAKKYLRITHSFEDDLLEELSVAARELCEKAGRLTIAEQKWAVVYRTPRVKALPFGLDYSLHDVENIASKVVLPKQPVVSVDEVNLVKHDGTKTAFVEIDEEGVGDYRFDTIQQCLFWNEQLFVKDYEYPYLEIKFTCGLPRADINKDLKTAVLIVLADLYENRGSDTRTVPPKAARLLSGYWSNSAL